MRNYLGMRDLEFEGTMVLRISMVAIKGVAPVLPLSAEFDERGGSIGRDASNQMVLPDPERHLSRVQALIKNQGGEFLLIDQGGNPTSVNGSPLGKGQSSLLRDGDRIEMAEFVLSVELLRKAPSFLGAATPAPATTSPAEPLPSVASSSQDPLGLFGSSPGAVQAQSESIGQPLAHQPPQAVVDPFAGLLSGASPVPSMPVEPAYAVPPAPASSDDPFAVFAARPVATEAPKVSTVTTEDPFAAFGTPAPLARQDTSPTQGADDPLGIGLGVAPAQPDSAGSVDSLFDLGSGSKTDPFANSALADPMGQPAAFPGHGGSADPLALLMGNAGTHAGFESTERNDAAILNDAFVPPSPAAPDIELEFEFSPAEQTAPAPAEKVKENVKAGADFLFGSTVEPLVQAPAAAVPKPFEPSVPPPFVTPAFAAREVSSDTKAPGENVSSESQALLDAFLTGLGTTGLKLEGGMTPALMQQIGLVVSEAVRGTVELLVARAMTKREVRADVTMIVSKNNNPLKFSPDVNFALMQLLQPRVGSGFMPPAEAMRDAYDDLRAHQIGFVAGMRAALAGVLGRFKPEELEGRLSEKSFLDSVLPANRKAKLWDLYEQRYTEISREAEDNFHSLFGREFLRAYEEQINRLHGEGNT